MELMFLEKNLREMKGNVKMKKEIMTGREKDEQNSATSALEIGLGSCMSAFTVHPPKSNNQADKSSSLNKQNCPKFFSQM